MNEKYVIELSGVSKKYKLYADNKSRLLEAFSPVRKSYHKEFFAIRDVNLQVAKGEILGILGKNGSGKSTLLKLISGVLTPSAGDVSTEGTIVPLLELGSAFHPEFSGIDNLYFYCIILGYPRSFIKDKIDEIVEFSELGEFIYQPYRSYSSGMKARLAFSASIFIDPDILLIDEILSVGDESFREKSFAKMKEFFESGKTILFVSHSVASIKELCTRAIMIDKGEIICEGVPDKVTEFYKKYWKITSSERAKLLEDSTIINLY